MAQDPSAPSDTGRVVPSAAVPPAPRRGPSLGTVVLVLMVAVMGAAIGRFWPTATPSETLVVRSTPSVIVAVRDLARLEGAEYRIERVISLKDEQSRFFHLVAAADAILLVASGTVVAGVDLSSLHDGDIVIDAARSTARITLPTSTVLSTRLDNDKTFVFKRDTDLLAERKDSLETQARQEAERTLLAAAEEGGIVQKSNDNVRRTVEALVRSLGYGTVTVTFRGRVPAGERP